MSNDKNRPVTMLCTYRAKPGKAAELRALVEKHGPALRQSGLISDEPVKVWQATDKRDHGRVECDPVYFVETFQWRDGEASSVAHQTPEIMSVWEPMGPLLAELQLAQLEPLS